MAGVVSKMSFTQFFNDNIELTLMNIEFCATSILFDEMVIPK